MSDNTYPQATTQIITDEDEAKDQVTTQVVEYLKSPKGQSHFTAGHLKEAIEAVEKSNGTVGLDGTVKDFLDLLGPKSIKALEDEPQKAKELANSIGRSIISQVRSNQQNLTYNKEKHGDAIKNFENLDKSKFDRDSVALGPEITNMLIQKADDLQANTRLNPHSVGLILATQLVDHDKVEGNKKDVIVALAVGMIAKVAGKQTPFKESLSQRGVPPVEVINAIVSAAVDIANKPEYFDLNPEKAMKFGKQLGKDGRDELYQNKMSNSDRLTEILTSRCHQSYRASIVPLTIIQQLSSSLKRTRSMTTPRSPRSPSSSTPNQSRKSGRSFP